MHIVFFIDEKVTHTRSVNWEVLSMKRIGKSVWVVRVF